MDDLAKRILGIPGDPDRRGVPVDARPVVFLVVPEVVRIALLRCHYPSPRL